jgi:hypothetical protein
MSENQSEESSVRKEIAIVAGPRGWGDTRESWLAIVPRRTKEVLGLKKNPFSFRTVKALFYGEIKDPTHWAARDIKRAAELIEARKEAVALMAKYQTMIGGLRAADENFYREEIDRLECLVGRLGAGGSTGTERE